MPKLLIVEDNEMNRDMLSRRLTRRGYEVVLAADGAEGVAKAGTEGPDLILMDMSLPVLDGWEATRRIKAAAGTRGIPVIALTAHAMAGDEARARAAGCDDFDTKPVDLARLVGKIERWLAPLEISLPARPESLAPLLAFVERACEGAGVDGEAAFALRLAAEEVCSNVIEHGYAGREPGPLRLRFRREPDAVVLVVEDRAREFDPATAPAADLESGWEERQIGGLGWHLVRRTMDEVRHEPLSGGGNRLTLVKRLPDAGR
jgi:two-component system, cell cycle response regulator DivK